jgi:hypothetical protein
MKTDSSVGLQEQDHGIPDQSHEVFPSVGFETSVLRHGVSRVEMQLLAPGPAKMLRCQHGNFDLNCDQDGTALATSVRPESTKCDTRWSVNQSMQLCPSGRWTRLMTFTEARKN